MNKWRLLTSVWRSLIYSLGLIVPLLRWKQKASLFVGMYRDGPRKRQKHNLSQILDCSRGYQHA